MTPPIRRRSLEEIEQDVAQRGQTPRRSLDTIAQETPPEPPSVAQKALSWVSSLARVQQSLNPVTMLATRGRILSDDPNAMGLAAKGVQGASYGTADEALDVAGVGGGGLRRTAQDFQERHPIAATAAEAVGAVLSAAPFVRLPASLISSGWRRLGSGMAVGAASGGAAGAGNAESGEKLRGAKIGATVGALAGLGGSAIGEVGKQGARAVGLGPKAASGGTATSNALGKAQGALGMETAEEAGARRLIESLTREGKTLDDVAGWAATRDAPDILAEASPRLVRDLRASRTFGNKAPGVIDDVLQDRAEEETSRLTRKIMELTGATADDAKELAKRRDALIHPVTGPLYKRVQNITADPDAVSFIASDIAELAEDGVNVWGKARAAQRNFPKAPMVDDIPLTHMTVGDLLTLRRTVDGMIDYGESAEGLNSIEKVAQSRLKDLRALVDQAVKNAGDDPAGRIAVQLADELTAHTKRGSEAFRQGEKSLRAQSPAELDRLKAHGDNPEMFRKGAASALLKKLGGVADEGSVQNPVPRIFGGETKRMAAREAFPDDASFGAARDAGRKAVDRLKTFRDVTGGSQTLDKTVDAVGFLADPSTITDAATGNVPGLFTRATHTEIGKRLLKQTAVEADELAKYLLAGAPGQLTVEEALAQLHRMAPQIAARVQAQMVRRAAVPANVIGARIAADATKQR